MDDQLHDLQFLGDMKEPNSYRFSALGELYAFWESWGNSG